MPDLPGIASCAMKAIQMVHARIHIVNQHIRKTAEDAAAGQLSVPAIERFLRTGEEIWEGAGSGRFTLAQINQDGIYTQAVKTGMTTLFDLLLYEDAGQLHPG
jgi:hypothetical protein